MKLPVDYDSLTPAQRKQVREEYCWQQNFLCLHCKGDLQSPPPKHISEMYINWQAFPPNFLKYPIHLQHNHDTGMTEGAVHSYCNAVMWQYHGR